MDDNDGSVTGAKRPRSSKVTETSSRDDLSHIDPSLPNTGTSIEFPASTAISEWSSFIPEGADADQVPQPTSAERPTSHVSISPSDSVSSHKSKERKRHRNKGKGKEITILMDPEEEASSAEESNHSGKFS